MGYSDEQRHDLEETINSSEADVVLIATPIDLRKVCDIKKPAVRLFYELDGDSTEELAKIVRSGREGWPVGPHLHHQSALSLSGTRQ
jgi:predicted GTPase